MTQAERKATLRTRALARRLAKHEDERADDSRAVCTLIKASDAFLQADCVLLYAPVRGEIDPTPVASAAARHGIPVGYPKVEADGHMTYRLVPNAKALVPGAFGIPSPSADAPEVQPTAKTLLLIPALMADMTGYRLGYGGGYFDRFLPSFPGVAVLVLPADEIIPCLPVEENDVPVPYLVTPTGWRRALSQICTM